MLQVVQVEFGYRVIVNVLLILTERVGDVIAARLLHRVVAKEAWLANFTIETLQSIKRLRVQVHGIDRVRIRGLLVTNAQIMLRGQLSINS